MATPAHLYKLNTVPKTLTALLANGPGPPMTQQSGLPQMLDVAVKTKMINLSMATFALQTKMNTVLKTPTALLVNGPGQLTIQTSGIHRRLDVDVKLQERTVIIQMIKLIQQMSSLMATPALQTKMNTVPKTLTALPVNGLGPPMTQLSGLP